MVFLSLEILKGLIHIKLYNHFLSLCLDGNFWQTFGITFFQKKFLQSMFIIDKAYFAECFLSCDNLQYSSCISKSPHFMCITSTLTPKLIPKVLSKAKVRVKFFWLFFGKGWPTEGVTPYIRLVPLSEIRFIANRRHDVRTFERLQDLSLGFAEGIFAVVITTTPRRHS